MISIIIPVFNKSKTITECLQSIFQQNLSQMDLQIEVIVVMDRCNKETEDTISDFRQQYSNLRFMSSYKPGVNAAKNMGIFQARGAILLFLDEDCVLPDSKWLLRLKERLREYPLACVLGGGYMLRDEKNLFNLCEATLIDLYIEKNIQRGHLTRALLGGNAVYRREVFTDIGCFDDQILYGGDETECNHRLLMHGEHLFYFGDLSVYHLFDRKNSILKFVIKNFKHGRGNGYIHNRHGDLGFKLDSQYEDFWFVNAAKRMNLSLVDKIKAGLMLFLFSFCYCLGFKYEQIAFHVRRFLLFEGKDVYKEHRVFKINGEYPFISIVLPTHNRMEKLKKCIAVLLAQAYPEHKREIIVINDGSSDGTEEYLHELRKDHMAVRFKTISHSGYSVARNTGFDLAKGEFIATLDDDCIVDKDWLSKIVLTFKRHPEACAVGGSIDNPFTSKIAWAQHLLSFAKWLPAGQIRPMADISTANIAYKRREIKGFSFIEDGKYLYYRDILFNLALVKTGKKIIFNPYIKVYHHRYAKVTFRDLYAYQKYYAAGFLNNGYKAHGQAGQLLFKYPFLNLFLPRIVIIFMSCLRSSRHLSKFIWSFPLLLRGEWARSKAIFLMKKGKSS